MRADALEQLFVKRRAGRVELLLVLESPAGERRRLTLATPVADEGAAIDYLARYLTREGFAPKERLRARREVGAGLEEAPALKSALMAAYARESRR